MLGLSVVVCKLQSTGVNPVLAVLLTLLVGAVVGLINGFIVVGLRINSFIATLGMSSVLGALVYCVSGNQQVTTGISERFVALGQGAIWGIPLPVMYLAVIAAVIGFVLENVGETLQAMLAAGSVAAELLGEPSDRLKSMFAEAPVRFYSLFQDFDRFLQCRRGDCRDNVRESAAPAVCVLVAR